MQHNHVGNTPRPKRQWRANFVLIAFLMIAGFYLIVEHRAHLFGYWPLLLLLACPLLHMFMHGGHGGHGETEPPTESGNDRPPPPASGGHKH